jgi:hypothetical protein
LRRNGAQFDLVSFHLLTFFLNSFQCDFSIKMRFERLLYFFMFCILAGIKRIRLTICKRKGGRKERASDITSTRR